MVVDCDTPVMATTLINSIAKRGKSKGIMQLKASKVQLCNLCTLQGNAIFLQYAPMMKAMTDSNS